MSDKFFPLNERFIMYMKKPCDICKNEGKVRQCCPGKNLHHSTLRDAIQDYPDYAYLRLRDIIHRKYIKKDLCEYCQRSLTVYCKTAIKWLGKNYTNEEIEICATEWLVKRMKSLGRNRYGAAS